MNGIQADDLRRFWYDALADMLRSMPLAERKHAIWRMSPTLYWMIVDICDPRRYAPVAMNPIPAHGFMLMGKAVEFVDQDHVSLA